MSWYGLNIDACQGFAATQVIKIRCELIGLEGFASTLLISFDVQTSLYVRE
jgi:hypothetical protein